jgi:FMN phosphatase YigB (HAD superfamily)
VHLIQGGSNYPELPEMADKLGLSPWLSGTVVSARVGYEKPRREIFEIALAAAGHPDVCYMTGDNPAAGIAGAQAVGIPAILVHNKPGSTADFVCGSLTDVLGVLRISGGS